MRRRAIMVDVDGVLLTHPDLRGWSVHLERDLGLSRAALQHAFFAPHWADVVHGRATLRERLTPVLAGLSPTVTYDALTRYWFSHDAHVNEDLLRHLQALRRAGTELHLATVQEHERARYLWDELGFRDKFDGIHYAAALGHAKPAIDFYRAVERAVALEPSAIFFVDDREENVAAARECGWTAALWTGCEPLSALIEQQRWTGD